MALAALACLVGCAEGGAPESLEGSVAETALAQDPAIDLGLDPASQLSVVEDFAYPDAERFRARGINLKTGDGHLLLVDCGSPDVTLTVESFAPPDDFCFQVRGPRAFVALELTNVFLITAPPTTQPGLKATTLLASGQRDIVAIGPSANPIGGGAGATLLELTLAP